MIIVIFDLFKFQISFGKKSQRVILISVTYALNKLRLQYKYFTFCSQISFTEMCWTQLSFVSISVWCQWVNKGYFQSRFFIGHLVLITHSTHHYAHNIWGESIKDIVKVIIKVIVFLPLPCPLPLESTYPWGNFVTWYIVCKASKHLKGQLWPRVSKSLKIITFSFCVMKVSCDPV